MGRKRDHNEDSFFIDDSVGLYIVADGMGGHAAGEIASREAVETLDGMIRRGRAEIESFKKKPTQETLAALRRLMESAIQAATYMVFAIAEQDPTHKGMGTTMTAALFVDNVCIVGSVGDSRAYLVRDNRAWQVTEDHTLVQLQLKAGLLTEAQARNSPRGNVITRAVGPREYVQVDTFAIPVQPNDRYLLCSDGLHTYIETTEIPDLISGRHLEECCELLVNLANHRGGQDNITCVVIHIFGV